MSAAKTIVPLVLALMLPALAEAAEVLRLQAKQAQSLGIETQLVPEFAQTGGRYPAKVLVPNEQMRVIAAPVAGLLEHLAVAPGSVVKRGQLLARIASPQALELQRDALQAGSQSELLSQSLKRDEQLFAEGLIPESRLQATRAAAAQAGAQSRERQQSLALAGLSAGKLGGALVLSAPIDGVVLEQGGQLGQRVEAATLIYRIARLSPLWLEIQAPLEIAGGLRLGEPIKLADSALQGKLIAIGRAVDPASQTVLLRAAIEKGAERLIPGQVLSVELGSGNPGARLPSAALVRHEGQDWVFVQSAANPGEKTRDGELVFTPRVVKLMGQGSQGVVVDGLRPGEKVAVKGVSGLKAMLTGVGKE